MTARELQARQHPHSPIPLSFCLSPSYAASPFPPLSLLSNRLWRRHIPRSWRNFCGWLPYVSHARPDSAATHPTPTPTSLPKQAVEKAYPEILEEFLRVTADEAGLKARGESIWVAAVRDDALAYGKHLLMQYISKWGLWGRGA